MKFVSLRMRNWRSFNGDHKIEFSVDPKRPVTLLLAPNGAGKTALLNAITWAIYGEFTEGFDDHDSLINLAAVKAEESAETSVELILQHEEDEYIITRSTGVKKTKQSINDLLITRNGLVTVESELHNILPRALKELFFIPAESFSTASVLKADGATEGSSFAVGNAIHALLSGDIYQNASADIHQAMISETLKLPQRGPGQAAVDSAYQRYSQALAELDELQQRKDKLPSEISIAKKAFTDARAEAEKYDPQELERIKKKTNELIQQVGMAEKAAADAESLYLDLSRRSHLYLARNSTQAAIRRLNQAEAAGLMPPRIDISILEKTLASRRCFLCETPLTANANERIQVLKGRASNAQVAIRGVEARTMLKQIFDKGMQEEEPLRDSITKLVTDLKLKTFPSKEANILVLASIVRSCISVSDKYLQQAQLNLDKFMEETASKRPAEGSNPLDILTICQKRLYHLENEYNEIDNRIREARKSLDAAFKDYQNKEGKSDAHKQKTAAIGILQEAKDYFNEAKQGLEDFGRKDFEAAINKLYKDLILKPFLLKVDPDFGIRVLQRDGGENVPLSQSEKVLLLIAFLGAMARLAPLYQDIAKQNLQLNQTGNVKTSEKRGFPVVIDSPTSPLDEEYEVEVVKVLPNLLPQIIVPVSAKSIKVWETIAEKVGKAYVMELTSNTSTNRMVKWNGKDHRYSVKANIPHAQTRIELIH